MQTDPNRHPGLADLDRALAAGDVEGARQALLLLNDHERALLAEEIGPAALQTAYRGARSRRRGPGLGRVMVLPGLMGTELDSVDAGGDSDLIWVNFFRIFDGRMADLRLTPNGDPPPAPPSIRVKQVYKKVYLPILMTLQARWQTRPFPYDWRRDIDGSAAALAEDVRRWAGGEPVHLIAHSMGGLVARRFIQKFPEVWATMQDPQGQGRGGRLIMMGTPNRGSLASAMALTGEEGIVQKLDLLDVHHDKRELQEILNTFLGTYQILPTPLMDLGDDHKKLFQAGTWGNLPVHQGLLDRAKAFITELDPVLDPGRLLYIAGYHQETPHRVKVEGPGRFKYESTLDGDGRVTHELGLLPGVTTFWVYEAHGDIPKNAKVLAGIHDLLQKGTTSSLEMRRGAVRAARATQPYDPRVAERPEPEMHALLATLKPSRAVRKPPSEAEELAAVRLEALTVEDWLGSPGPAREAARGVGAGAAAAGAGAAQARPADGPPARLKVEVVWGDISKAQGDVYAVGHYRGVLPQRALLALDKVVSHREEPPFVLTEQVRRGLLRGDLGDVEFFPWGDKVVAVAGMGHPGTFGEAQARLVARNLTWAVASLPGRRVICTVLIGSGEGNMNLPDAVEALFRGMGDALADVRARTRVDLLRIVEMDAARARETLEAVRRLAQAPGPLVLDVRQKTPSRGAGARSAAPARPRRQVAAGEPPAVAARVTFVNADGAVRAAVLTRTATIPERSLSLDLSLVEQLVERLKDPDPQTLPRLSALLRRLLLPREFAGALPFDADADPAGRDRSPIVFEVDRYMARVNWEMLAAEADTSAGSSVALRKHVARQLRTEYSPPPAPEANPGRARRALVVGDPGDPQKGHSLPGARREALRVAEILAARNLEVACYVGAAGDPEQAALGVPPATRLDVLDRLLEGGWDILHYAGHGDFDPKASDRAGWLFADGLLTSRELERMDTAPRLVVANACLSGLTSMVGPAGSVLGRRDAALLASLADEFFRRGVRDYVGTAWEVNDEGAIQFAERLYGALLDPSGGADCTLGGAMLQARRALAEREDVFGALWAAYQHYGDPTACLVDAGVPAPSAKRPAPQHRSRGKRTKRKR
jgi:pimeloyl-ACP methyl ester carboxylesterase